MMIWRIRLMRTAAAVQTDTKSQIHLAWLLADVRLGSLADICSAKGHVRFAPERDRESGHPRTVMFALPLKADVCGARDADVINRLSGRLGGHTTSNETPRICCQLYIFECLVIASIMLRVSNWNALCNRELPALFICATPFVLVSHRGRIANDQHQARDH